VNELQPLHTPQLRFVVLMHDWPEAHLDLFLEQNGVLWAWRLPVEDSGGDCIATANHDHRLHYLDYEGPVSGGRGTVARWDTGGLEWLSETPERIEVRLTGGKLNGIYTLTRIDGQHWRFDPVTSPCPG
jgi:hypothetical protein